MSTTFSKNFNSLRRWKIGHQLFSSIDLWLIFALEKAKVALSEKKWSEAADLFYRSAQLLESSAVALKYTGDMPEGVYNEETKNDMQEYAPDKMSGGNIWDHVYLVRLIKEINKGKNTWPSEVLSAHISFTIAVSAGLDSHIHACVAMAGQRAPLSKPGLKMAEEHLVGRDSTRRKEAGCPFAHS